MLVEDMDSSDMAPCAIQHLFSQLPESLFSSFSSHHFQTMLLEKVLSVPSPEVAGDIGLANQSITAP